MAGTNGDTMDIEVHVPGGRPGEAPVVDLIDRVRGCFPGAAVDVTVYWASSRCGRTGLPQIDFVYNGDEVDPGHWARKRVRGVLQALGYQS